MIKETKKAPTIRFRDFTDDWEQRKLGDFVEFFSGLTYTPKDVQKNGTLVLRSSNVNNGEIIDADNVYVNPQVVNSDNVKIGDIIVVVRNGSRSLIGKHAKVKNFMPNTVIGAFMTGIRSKYPEFTNALLSTSKFRREVTRNMGATINQITGYMFSKMEFEVPSLNEQKNIGEYFRTLDFLITLHQRKLDQLKTLKKYFLQNMFPAKGEKVPRIRFKGFTGDWEQRKLGELMEVGSVKRVHQSDWRDSGVRFLRARDVVAEYKNEQPDDYLYIDERMYNAYSALSGKVQKGDLLVTGVGTIGIPMLIKSDKPVYFKDGNIIWFKNKNAINGDFFYYAFISSQIQNFIKEAAGTGTVGTYTIASGKKTPIALPVNRKEQEQIGAYIGGLDNLITLHQRKLDQLQTMKKFMLQNLFI